jgi:hypothetical protein
VGTTEDTSTGQTPAYGQPVAAVTATQQEEQ